MNKNDIYEYIGYKGKYTKEVKSKLRKLLKKYHPDQKNGDIKTFKLINSVKSDLEKNTLVIESSQDNSHEVFHEDLEYYYRKIKVLTNKKESLQKEIKTKNKLLNTYLDEYAIIYDRYFDNLEFIMDYQSKKDQLTGLKKYYILYIPFFIITIILKKYWIMLLIAAIFLINQIIIYFLLNKNLNVNSQYILKDKDLKNKKDDYQQKILNLKREMIDLEGKLNNINNDIRFYQNIINNSSNN